jgi:hypothetical protein
MTNPVASTPDSYRAYADECHKLANDAADIETKAAFQLTAKAWTMLATQVEARVAAATHPILETAAQ